MTTPSGSLPIDQFIEEAALNNDVNHFYLVLRSKCPISLKQAKNAYNKVRNKFKK